MHHHRLVELRRNVGFVRRSQVAAPFEIVFQRAFGVGFLQHLYGFVVSDARERGFNLFQLRDIAPDDLQIAAPLLQAALHQKADQAFGQVHEVVEFGVGHFRLDHPEFGQVAAGLGFFRAKRWPEGIHLAQRHGRGFDVELAGLREIRLLVEIIDREKRAGAFAGGRSKNRRIGEDEAALVEEIARRLDDLRPHPQNRRLPRRPHPQVAVLHQEIDAVLFR